MKLLISAIASVVLFAGCATKQENSNAGNSPAPANQAAAGNAEKATQGSSTSATNTGAKTDGNPVEFTCLGLSADKTHFSYRVKVNTDKPISQVDIEVKSVDAKGKSSTETFLWQNIVKSTQQPIEKGKTYDVDENAVAEGTTKVECKMKRVVFVDGTSWSPK
jgi:hypothetical protein